MTLQNRAGWVTLLNGIVCVDQMCDRQKTDFSRSMRPEVLERYCVERQPDVYHALCDVAKKRNVSNEQLSVVVGTLSMTEIAGLLEEYDTGICA